ncbi:Histone deacetylase 6 [Gonapodya sp. JEL0774]|nr:Histone deacetylase 6 [Gonapodya sp. JEL0774]
MLNLPPASMIAGTGSGEPAKKRAKFHPRGHDMEVEVEIPVPPRPLKKMLTPTDSENSSAGASSALGRKSSVGSASEPRSPLQFGSDGKGRETRGEKQSKDSVKMHYGLTSSSIPSDDSSRTSSTVQEYKRSVTLSPSRPPLVALSIVPSSVPRVDENAVGLKTGRVPGLLGYQSVSNKRGRSPDSVEVASERGTSHQAAPVVIESVTVPLGINTVTERAESAPGTDSSARVTMLPVAPKGTASESLPRQPSLPLAAAESVLAGREESTLPQQHSSTDKPTHVHHASGPSLPSHVNISSIRHSSQNHVRPTPTSAAAPERPARPPVPVPVSQPPSLPSIPPTRSSGTFASSLLAGPSTRASARSSSVAAGRFPPLTGTVPEPDLRIPIATAVSSQRTVLAYDPRMLSHRILPAPPKRSSPNPFVVGAAGDNVDAPPNLGDSSDDEDDDHPEQPGRIQAIMGLLEREGLASQCLPLPVREVTRDELELVHGGQYLDIVDRIKDLDVHALRRLPNDLDYNSVYFCAETAVCARLSCGAVVDVCKAICRGIEVRNGVAVVRPPGHHAEKDEAMGFCIYNNVAVAAKVVQRDCGVSRVMIVDWDVHHGQEGHHSMVGTDAGRGFNVNVDWDVKGMGDAEYLWAFERVVMPIGREFDPDLVIVSAGFDAAAGDPLGGCNVTPVGYAHMTHMLSELAGGKVAVILEKLKGLYTALKSSMSFMRHVVARHREEVLATRWSLSPNSVLPLEDVDGSGEEDALPLDGLAHEISFTEFDQSDLDRDVRENVCAQIFTSDPALNNMKNGPVWAVWHESPVVRAFTQLYDNDLDLSRSFIFDPTIPLYDYIFNWKGNFIYDVSVDWDSMVDKKVSARTRNDYVVRLFEWLWRSILCDSPSLILIAAGRLATPIVRFMARFYDRIPNLLEKIVAIILILDDSQKDPEDDLEEYADRDVDFGADNIRYGHRIGERDRDQFESEKQRKFDEFCVWWKENALLVVPSSQPHRSALPPSASAFKGKRISSGMETVTAADVMPFFIRPIVQHGLARLPQSGKLGVAKKWGKSRTRDVNGGHDVASVSGKQSSFSVQDGGPLKGSRGTATEQRATHMTASHGKLDVSASQPAAGDHHSTDDEESFFPAEENLSHEINGLVGGTLADARGLASFGANSMNPAGKASAVPPSRRLDQDDRSIHPSTPPVDASSDRLTSPVHPHHGNDPLRLAAKFGADLDPIMLIGPYDNGEPTRTLASVPLNQLKDGSKSNGMASEAGAVAHVDSDVAHHVLSSMVNGSHTVNRVPPSSACSADDGEVDGVGSEAPQTLEAVVDVDVDVDGLQDGFLDLEGGF